ncbi:hypothetical protein OKW40_001064 [Paraburkholderia sp. RAU6.4a]|nr:hypothetical protein [Paraburkholderia sp. HC6.4b]MBB5456047.1 hypothetical protein [Paraburkholderia sp. Kb1A]
MHRMKASGLGESLDIKGFTAKNWVLSKLSQI